MTPVRNCKNLCFEEPWDWDRQIINAMSPGEVNANKNFFFLTNPKKKRKKIYAQMLYGPVRKLYHMSLCKRGA